MNVNYRRKFKPPKNVDFIYMGTIDKAPATVDVYYYPEKDCVGIRTGMADWYSNTLDTILREPFIRKCEVDAAKYVQQHPLEDACIVGVEPNGTLIYWNAEKRERYNGGDTLDNTESVMNELEYVRAGGDPDLVREYLTKRGWVSQAMP